MVPAKYIQRPETAALAAPNSWDANLAKPTAERNPIIRIAGNEVNGSLALLFRHDCFGAPLEFGQFHHRLQSCHLGLPSMLHWRISQWHMKYA
jgi:hypothetical protein